MVDIGEAFRDLENLMVETGLLDGGRAAGTAGIIGVPVDLQAGISRSLQQQRDVLAPVAGDDAVGARRLDLRDIGREVGDLEQRMQLVADDLNISAFGFEHGARLRAHRLTKRIVLIDQVHFLDARRGLHVVGQRLHLDVGARVPAEMIEAALLVGEDRIDGSIVEVQDFFARIAFVVFGDEVGQRAGDGRAVALGEVAHAAVNRLLRLDQALLRIGLVVQWDDLDLLAEDAALGVQLVGQELEGLEADFADAGAAAGEWIDVTDLHGLLRHRRAAEHRQRDRRNEG